MCNAIQQRMVEESVVAKEVYDAMMQMRNRLNDIFGLPVPTPENVDLPDVLPPGVPPVDEGQPAASKRPNGYRSLGNQVPSDVLAAADVSRQRSAPKQPVKPYIPPTMPKDGANPFPGLSGPLG